MGGGGETRLRMLAAGEGGKAWHIGGGGGGG